MMPSILKWTLAGALFCNGAELLACASCGSGGDDPLILYPWETWKVYAGFARAEDFENIDQSGNSSSGVVPDSRNTTTISFGHSFSSRAFATVTAPYIVNKRGPYQRSGWGDPMLTGRYTVVQQDISEEWIPQVQLITAVRAGQATSMYDYEDPAMLDVFGSGVPDWRVGFDVWHGMFDWKAGFAQIVTGPLDSKRTESGVYRNGITSRSTATVGYGWGDRGKVITGVNHEQTTKRTLDGVALQGSEIIANSAFISADAKVGHQSMVRLTLSRSAAFGLNKFGSRSDSVTVSLMRSL